MKKQYLVVASRAPRPRRLGELIGVTTKRTADPADRKTIGFFGTGSKMAPALAGRLGIDVSVFSTDADGPYRLTYGSQPIPGVDQKQVVFEYRVPGYRNTTRVPAGFSNEIGVPHWSRADQVVREYVIDAYDADPCFTTKSATLDPDKATIEALQGIFRGSADSPAEFKTFALIEMTPEVYEVAADFNQRFRLPRPGVEFRDELHRRGLRAIIAKEEPGPLQVYVRGIRCSLAHLGKRDITSSFDYAIDVPLNEEREIRSWWDVVAAISNTWGYCDDPKLVRGLIAMHMLGRGLGQLELEELSVYYVCPAWAEAIQGFGNVLLASGKSELDERAAQRGNRVLRMPMLTSGLDLPRVTSDITTPGLFRVCELAEEEADQFDTIKSCLARVLASGTTIQPCRFGDVSTRAAIVDDAGTVLVNCDDIMAGAGPRAWLQGVLGALRGVVLSGLAQARVIHYDADSFAAQALLAEHEGRMPGAALVAFGLIKTSTTHILCDVVDELGGTHIEVMAVTHDATLDPLTVAAGLKEQREEILTARPVRVTSVVLATINNIPAAAEQPTEELGL